MVIIALLQLALGLAAAPLLLGVINRTKAFFAGRQGPPLWQPYHDLRKLLGKGTTYSGTTTVIFRAGPVVGLAAVTAAAALLPMAGQVALVAFPGDLLLLVYLLGLARFATVLAALDTGSAFEGMGASREVTFAALAEPALLLGLTAVCRLAGTCSLSQVMPALTAATWLAHGPALALVLSALFVVLLAENSRIPFDDPNTHLELTMIHEVMVLDHGGPDLALILYGAALKLWLLAALLVGLALPLAHLAWPVALLGFFAAMLAVAVLVGIVESAMARLRLVRVPQLLVGAGALTVISLALVLR